MLNYHYTVSAQLSDRSIKGIRILNTMDYKKSIEEILVTHYRDESAVLALINGGDVSILRDTVDTSEFFIRDRGHSSQDHKNKEFNGFTAFEHNEFLRDINFLYMKNRWFCYNKAKPKLGWVRV